MKEEIVIKFEELIKLMGTDGSINSHDLRDLVVKKFKENLAPSIEPPKPKPKVTKKSVEKKLPKKVVKAKVKKPKQKKGKVQNLMDRAFPLFDEGEDYKEVAKKLGIKPSYASVLKSYWKKAKEQLQDEEEDFVDVDEFYGD